MYMILISDEEYSTSSEMNHCSRRDAALQLLTSMMILVID